MTLVRTCFLLTLKIILYPLLDIVDLRKFDVFLHKLLHHMMVNLVLYLNQLFPFQLNFQLSDRTLALHQRIVLRILIYHCYFSRWTSWDLRCMKSQGWASPKFLGTAIRAVVVWGLLWGSDAFKLSLLFEIFEGHWLLLEGLKILILFKFQGLFNSLWLL